VRVRVCVCVCVCVCVILVIAGLRDNGDCLLSSVASHLSPSLPFSLFNSCRGGGGGGGAPRLTHTRRAPVAQPPPFPSDAAIMRARQHRMVPSDRLLSRSCETLFARPASTVLRGPLGHTPLKASEIKPTVVVADGSKGTHDSSLANTLLRSGSPLASQATLHVATARPHAGSAMDLRELQAHQHNAAAIRAGRGTGLSSLVGFLPPPRSAVAGPQRGLTVPIGDIRAGSTSDLPSLRLNGADLLVTCTDTDAIAPDEQTGVQRDEALLAAAVADVMVVLSEPRSRTASPAPNKSVATTREESSPTTHAVPLDASSPSTLSVAPPAAPSESTSQQEVVSGEASLGQHGAVQSEEKKEATSVAESSVAPTEEKQEKPEPPAAQTSKAADDDDGARACVCVCVCECVCVFVL
jgi:hypothetical protein